MEQKEIDEVYMRRCLQLAKNGRQNAKPNPMVGAVIVSEDGRIGNGAFVIETAALLFQPLIDLAVVTHQVAH